MKNETIAHEKYVVSIIKRLNNKHALGYESTLDFNFGLIEGWYAVGFITKKFYNELIDNYVKNDGEEESQNRIEKKYGRLLKV